jgi:Tetratricopeptide repeat
MSFLVRGLPDAYGRSVDAFAWGVVGSVAGVAGAAAAIVFGVIPLVHRRRGTPNDSIASGATEVSGGQGVQVGGGSQQVNQYIQTYIEGQRLPGPHASGLVVAGETPPRAPAFQSRDLGTGIAEALSDATVVLRAGDIPREPPGYQARDELLGLLDPPVGGRVAVVQALTGMRGVGKSQLAAAFARARLAEGWRLVAWVDAETQQELLAGLAETAAALGLAADDAPRAGRLVRRRLEADGDRCLLVFDNATDPDLVEPFIPATGRARVVITSNNQAMANLGTAVPVDVFTEHQAADFLAERTGYPDQPDAATLAEELGYLPLALAQAAAVIAAQRVDYATYLQRMRRQPLGDLLGPVAAGQYRHGIAAAIVLALDTPRAGDPSGVSAAVMDLLAVLSPAGVPRALIHTAGEQGLLTTEVRPADVVDEALARLAGTSLVTFSLDGATVSAHQLVMRVIRDLHASAGTLGQVCDRAARLLGSQAEVITDALASNRVGARNLTVQIRALHEFATPFAADRDLTARMLRLNAQAVYVLLGLGDSPPAALRAAEEVTSARERILGRDHPDTLTSRDNLANAYHAAGRTAEAITLHQQNLADRERVLGPDHPDTLTSRNNLANDYQVAGRTAKAITLHQQNLADRQRVLGRDHPDTLTSRNNLAIGYLVAGRTAEAITLHEQNLAARERMLSPDHPDVLQSRGNLANSYQAADRTAEAINLHEQNLAACARVLGPDHPDTLSTRSNLASSYQAVGRTAEAITLDLQNLAACERVLGPDHPDTLTSRNNLAAGYRGVGRTAEAIALDEQNLAARERVLGPDHPDTLVTRNNLAGGYRGVGRTAEAINLHEQNLAARERILGPDHPDTLQSRNNLANANRKARSADATRLEPEQVADPDAELS